MATNDARKTLDYIEGRGPIYNDAIAVVKHESLLLCGCVEIIGSKDSFSYAMRKGAMAIIHQLSGNIER